MKITYCDYTDLVFNIREQKYYLHGEEVDLVELGQKVIILIPIKKDNK